MSNKTIFTDLELRQIAALVEDIKNDKGLVRIHDSAHSNFLNNAHSARNGDFFVAECWTLAVLASVHNLGYEIKKK